MENGTFLNCIEKTCPICHRTMNQGLYKRWGHGENCKPKYHLISPNNEVIDVYSYADLEKEECL